MNEGGNLMVIQTTIWGELEVSDDQTVHFAKGIPGFEQETDFVLIEVKESPFNYLQSMKQSELSFVITDPFVFHTNYEFDLPEHEAEELSITDEVHVQCIVTLHELIEQSTINLLAPLVFNPQNKQGKQVVLHHSSYQTRHRLWYDPAIEMEQKEEGE